MPLPFIKINENVSFKLFGTIGNQYVERFVNYGIPNNNYWDWQLGATATVCGFDLTVAYTDTNIDVAGCLNTQNCDGRVIFAHQQDVLIRALLHRRPSRSCGRLAARPAAAIYAMRLMDSDRFDLAVVGAGLNGSLLALAAGEAGLQTALIDRVPLASLTEAGFDGRTTAIAYTSQRLFEAIGVWDDARGRAEPILDIRISDAGHDGRASPLFLHFDHREAADDGGRARADGLDRREPLPARRAAAAAGRPARRSSWWRPTRRSRPSAIADRAELTLKSGRRLAARLVASAEGRFGTMREDAGIGARAWSYDQIAIVLVARHERPHRGVAQEKFLPGGPFAILPMRDGADGRASLVDRLDRARRRSRAACSSSTRRASRPSSPAASAIISATSSRPARAGGIRSGWSMPSAMSTRGWCWSATPRTASIPSRARATISACATSRPWSRCWSTPSGSASTSAPPTRSSATRNGGGPTISPWSPPPTS